MKKTVILCSLSVYALLMMLMACTSPFGNSSTQPTPTPVATISATPVTSSVSPSPSAVVTSSTTPSPSATASAAPVVLLTGISVDPTSISLIVGGTAGVKCAIIPETATDKSVVWSSSDTTIATVNTDGLVTAVSPGKATVSVTSISNPTAVANCEVVVSPVPPSDEQLVASAKTKLDIGFALGDTAASITGNLVLPTTGENGVTIVWSSDKPLVVTESGVVTRPAASATDESVVLTATISKTKATDIKTFTINVVRLPLIDTSAADIATVKSALNIGFASGESANAVTQNISLMNNGSNGVSISWSSDNAVIISNSGVVTQPAYANGDATVVLTATISKGGLTDTKTFTCTVIKSVNPAIAEVAAVKSALAVIFAAGDNAVSVTQNVTFAATGANGTTISWSSENTAVVSNAGVVYRPTFASGDSSVNITATISKGGVSETKTFTLTVLKSVNPAIAEVATAKSALVVSFAVGDSTASVTQNITLVATGTNGTAITWASDTASVISSTGVVNRPAFASGDASVVLTATISKGGVSETKTFTLTVVKTANPAIADVAAAKSALAITYASGDTINAVTQNVTLTTTGANGATISWASATLAVISNTGVVSRPAYASGDANVVLTATISKGGVTDTKTFTLTVVKTANPAIADVAAAKAALVITYAAGDSASAITQNVTLAATGANGASISWSSDKTAVVSNAGVVNRPASSAADSTVVLTATLTKSGISDTKVFTVIVKKQELKLVPTVGPVASSTAPFNFDNETGYYVDIWTGEVPAPTSADNFGTNITYTDSSNGTRCIKVQLVGTPVDAYGNTGRAIRLTAPSSYDLTGKTTLKMKVFIPEGDTSGLNSIKLMLYSDGTFGNYRQFGGYGLSLVPGQWNTVTVDIGSSGEWTSGTYNPATCVQFGINLGRNNGAGTTTRLGSYTYYLDDVSWE